MKNILNKKRIFVIFNLDVFINTKIKCEKNIYRLSIDSSGIDWIKMNRKVVLKAVEFPKYFNKA